MLARRPLRCSENLILGQARAAWAGQRRLIDHGAPRRRRPIGSLRLPASSSTLAARRRRCAGAPTPDSLKFLRLLYREAPMCSFSTEPTAVLAPAAGSPSLIALMRRLKGEGRTILFISHKLDEVIAVADASSASCARRPASRRDDDRRLRPAQGRTRALDGRRARRISWNRALRGRPCAGRAAALCARWPRRARQARFHVTRLGPVDLDISAGEIVGIAGVAGNGQDELAACAASELGAIRSPRRRHFVCSMAPT